MMSKLFFCLATAGLAYGTPDVGAKPLDLRHNATTGVVQMNSTSVTILGNSTRARSCSAPWYNSTMYECFAGGKLCPRYNGTPMLPCGNDCYYPRQYDCRNNRLLERSKMEGPFQIFASNPEQLKLPENKLVIQACHNVFFLQDGPACGFCPQWFEEQQGKRLSGKDTVLRAPHSMDVLAPGGQRWYIAPQGALGYTVPHSSQSPKGSIFDGVDVYADGGFILKKGDGWIACPSDINPDLKEFPDKHYMIYAALPGRSHDESCIPINIIAKPYMGETPATWDYR